MKSDLLLKDIARYIRLSTAEEGRLVALLKNKKIRKRQFFLQEGEVQTHLAYVTAGCLRSYSIDNNGFEHILQFAPPGWWIGDMCSLIRRDPGTLYIDAVDDSELILLAKPDLDELFISVPALERFFRIIAENALVACQHRLIDHLSLPALERYAHFCKLYPSLIQCLPQKQVAAYIGVTPEFLSKMLNSSITKKQITGLNLD